MKKVQFQPLQYKDLHRFTEENVQQIAHHFLGENNERRGGALTSKKRMEIFLRYINDSGFQIGVGEENRVHRTTVCKTVSFVMLKIVEKSHIWIKFPQTNTEIIAAKSKWNEKFKFPSAICAIDCTHVQILKPRLFGDEYINRKGFVSINVQATCDSNYIFISVDEGWPGSVHDSRILKNSQLFDFMCNNNTSSINLGDSGYGLYPWLMTPFKNPITEQEIYFNRILTRERVVIETEFGQLKRRFLFIGYKVRVLLNKIPKFILCCFILHNVSKTLNDPDDFSNTEERDNILIPEIEESESEIRGRANLLFNNREN